MTEIILTVADSASMPQAVSFAHEGAGYGVVEAADGDGAAALEIARRRAIPSCGSTLLLMLDAELGSEKRQDGKTAGAAALIVKPPNPEQLLNTFRNLLS